MHVKSYLIYSDLFCKCKTGDLTLRFVTLRFVTLRFATSSGRTDVSR